MARTVGVGYQDFARIRERAVFYVDKTNFIREWWEGKDEVTLIARPRRFGKTLNLSMVEKFFSVQYEGREDLFQGLAVWESEEYRKLQGSYPVISLSFANVKEKSYAATIRRINQILTNLYSVYRFLAGDGGLDNRERRFFDSVDVDMDESTATMAIHQLSSYLSRYYGKKVIILLDEYDTPMQEAYVNGHWDELVSFTRSMFNSSFKTNPYLERAIMTGITRVTKESIFSDLNNLRVVTTTSEKYMDCFGFTEEEVFAALDEFGFSDRKQEVKRWYDGFIFGSCTDIYNPWSIINYLSTGKLGSYWANSSSSRLAGELIREGSKEMKQLMEDLLSDKTIVMEIDEQIVYDQLKTKRNAVWSLLLASGYLKAVNVEFTEQEGRTYYELQLTNKEVKVMFEAMVRDWFSETEGTYNDFIKAMLLDDMDAMNEYMNRVTMTVFSYFHPSVSLKLPVDVSGADTGKDSSQEEPERFYHGFVLGLMVELSNRYILTSNRESGFGRYDVMLEPLDPEKDAGIIMEFKVFQPRKETCLEDTVEAALKQIEEKKYRAALMMRGLPKERIRMYGFGFRGKQVLIGNRDQSDI